MEKLEKYGKDYTYITKVWEVDGIVYVNKTRFKIDYTEMYDREDNFLGYITYEDNEKR